MENSPNDIAFPILYCIKIIFIFADGALKKLSVGIQKIYYEYYNKFRIKL